MHHHNSELQTVRTDFQTKHTIHVLVSSFRNNIILKSIFSLSLLQVKVNEEVEKVHSIIKESEAAGAKEAGATATEEAAHVSYSVQKAALEMQQSKAEAAVLEEHQRDLQESKEALKKELLSIMPGALKGEALESGDKKDVR